MDGTVTFNGFTLAVAAAIDRSMSCRAAPSRFAVVLSMAIH